MTNKPECRAKHREFDLKQADQIIEEYGKPNSMVDNGNLFFALVEYQEAYQELKEKLEIAKNALEFYGNKESWLGGDGHYDKIWDDTQKFLSYTIAGKKARQALSELERKDEVEE